MEKLMEYRASSDESDGEPVSILLRNDTTHLKPLVNFKQEICPAPTAIPTGLENELRVIDSATKEINYNLPYEELFAPENGPIHPEHVNKNKIEKNMLSGYVEPAHMSDFHFEFQRRNFLDDSVPNILENESKSEKRKRLKNDNPSDIDNFLGPWGGYIDEQKVSKPTDEEYAELQELLAKKQKRGKHYEEKSYDEKSVLHIKDVCDYQGRTFLHPPQDVGVNLKSDMPPDRCFLPKKQIHTWTGHLKGISAIRWFPKYAHLLLSSSMDCRVKLWEVYNQRRCIRTYYGHDKAVRDICFNNSGEQFLSAGYDKYIKLWDTETGQCTSRFTSRKIPYCVKFNPDNEKQNLFVAGTSDKKIICWDIRSGEIVQEYDRHLAAVNTITFVDENRRFVTTSDDKSLRVWEWDIPVDMKYIADPTMHSMPAVTLSPNQKWLACQSMDNKIVIFSALNRFKLNRNKVFTGHMVAGYACSIDFSPDMSYLYSGDADGKCYIWDWKTTKLYKKWKAHSKVCISTLCHPHEPSKVVTAGWDGEIKYWD